MGGCHSGKVEDNGDPNLIIDVEKVLADAAWSAFTVSHTKLRRRFLNRKKFTIEVPMHYYTFAEVSQPVINVKKVPQGIDVSSSSNRGPKSDLEKKGKALPYRNETNPSQIGLETEFNNDTDEDQTYTFQFEKTRTAAVEVSYQKGYSIGCKANFSIGLPSVFGDSSAGFEVEKQLQVTNASGERFEESLKTSATSNILVSKRNRYKASVVMEERNLMADFTIVMRMTMPQKCAPIYIKDKTGEVVMVRTVSNLYRLFKDFKQTSKVLDEGGKQVLHSVDFTVEGIIRGVQLSSHRINLTSEPSVQKQDVKSGEKDVGNSAEGSVQKQDVKPDEKFGEDTAFISL